MKKKFRIKIACEFFLQLRTRDNGSFAADNPNSFLMMFSKDANFYFRLDNEDTACVWQLGVKKNRHSKWNCRGQKRRITESEISAFDWKIKSRSYQTVPMGVR